MPYLLVNAKDWQKWRYMIAKADRLYRLPTPYLYHYAIRKKKVS